MDDRPLCGVALSFSLQNLFFLVSLHIYFLSCYVGSGKYSILASVYGSCYWNMWHVIDIYSRKVFCAPLKAYWWPHVLGTMSSSSLSAFTSFPLSALLFLSSSLFTGPHRILQLPCQLMSDYWPGCPFRIHYYILVSMISLLNGGR